jgi:hypothetical protein
MYNNSGVSALLETDCKLIFEGKDKVKYMFNINITILDIIHRPAVYLKHNVSETRLCLRLQVEPSQLFPFDGGSLMVRNEKVQPEVGYRIQSPKRCVLNKRQEDG